MPRDALTELVGRIAKFISIPVLVAAEFSNAQSLAGLVDAGASRVVVGAPALRDPNFITSLARTFGSGGVVVSIRSLSQDEGWRVAAGPDGAPTEWDAVTWARVVEAQGGGELLVSSSTPPQEGPFDLDLLRAVSSEVDIPVLAAGEAEVVEDLFDALMIGGAEGVLVGSLLHSGRATVGAVKSFLVEHGLGDN